MKSRLWILAAVAALAAGCAQVTKVATGEVMLRERMTVTTATTWNQFERGLGNDTPTWTQEGLTVDALQFIVAIKDGDLIAPTPSEPKGTRPLAFKATMQPAEIAKLYETLWTRDGSQYTLDRLAPETFAGQPGFRVEYSLVRKSDDVRLRGMAVGAVKDGQLFMIHYAAPRMAFFPRYQVQVESLIKTARLR